MYLDANLILRLAQGESKILPVHGPVEGAIGRGRRRDAGPIGRAREDHLQITQVPFTKLAKLQISIRVILGTMKSPNFGLKQ